MMSSAKYSARSSAVPGVVLPEAVSPLASDAWELPLETPPMDVVAKSIEYVPS